MVNPLNNSKFVPHKILRSGWTYLVLSDSDYVVGLQAAISKVVRLTKDGEVMNNPDGTPSYVIHTQNITKILTKAEWDELRKMEQEGGLDG